MNSRVRLGRRSEIRLTPKRWQSPRFGNKYRGVSTPVFVYKAEAGMEGKTAAEKAAEDATAEQEAPSPLPE